MRLESRKILLTAEGESSLVGVRWLRLGRRGARGAGRAGTVGVTVRPYAVEADPMEEYGWSGATMAA